MHSSTSWTTRTAAEIENALLGCHSDKNLSLLLKKPKLFNTYILPMRYPIYRHTRHVSPLRPHLSIMWL